MKTNDRNGLTLIELLVTISVIGLLLAITIPAVMQIRESSRRMQCASNLANLGRAMHGYEAVHRAYPPAHAATKTAPKLHNDRFYSVHARLLPYFDQNPLADKFRLDTQQLPHFDPRELDRADVAMTQVAGFRCPSDTEGPGTNYRVNLGPDPYFFKLPQTPHAAEGAFSALQEHTAQDFADGLSNTVAMSEKRKGGGDLAGFGEEDFWYTGVSNLGISPPRDDLIQICNSLTLEPADFHPYGGWTWYLSTYAYTWYNHAVGPNSENLDCTVSPRLSDFSFPAGAGIFKASSRHQTGVNCLWMDGSVRFIADGIDINVWRAFSTRAGGEVY